MSCSWSQTQIPSRTGLLTQHSLVFFQPPVSRSCIRARSSNTGNTVCLWGSLYNLIFCVLLAQVRAAVWLSWWMTFGICWFACHAFHALCWWENLLFLCRYLIGFMKDNTEPTWHGYLYAGLLFLVTAVQSLFLQQYFLRCMAVGMRVKTAVVAIVYKKVSLLFATRGIDVSFRPRPVTQLNHVKGSY